MSCTVFVSTTTKATKVLNTNTEGGVIFTLSIYVALIGYLTHSPKPKEARIQNLLKREGDLGRIDPKKGDGPGDLYPLFLVLNLIGSRQPFNNMGQANHKL